jgi:DNA-binding transcriptional regulator YdaS (Cro superfamily)
MTTAEFAATLDRLGWGATSLARLLGRPRQTVTQWQLGRVRVPDDVAQWLRAAEAWHAAHPPPRRAA